MRACKGCEVHRLERDIAYRRSLSARAHAPDRQLSFTERAPRVLTQPYGGGFIALPLAHTETITNTHQGETKGRGAQRRAPESSQPASELTVRGQSDGESMSGTSYQGKNSIPHLTVRDPAWSAAVAGEALRLYANPCCQCRQRGD